MMVFVFLWWTSDLSEVCPTSHPRTEKIDSSPLATLSWISSPEYRWIIEVDE